MLVSLYSKYISKFTYKFNLKVVKYIRSTIVFVQNEQNSCYFKVN